MKAKTSFSLSTECKELLRLMSAKLGLSQAGVIEMAVRQFNRHEPIKHRRVWYLTEESPHSEDEEAGDSLCCLAYEKETALNFLRHDVLGSEHFAQLSWETSEENPDYNYATGEWNGKRHSYMLSTEPILDSDWKVK